MALGMNLWGRQRKQFINSTVDPFSNWLLHHKDKEQMIEPGILESGLQSSPPIKGSHCRWLLCRLGCLIIALYHMLLNCSFHSFQTYLRDTFLLLSGKPEEGISSRLVCE